MSDLKNSGQTRNVSTEVPSPNFDAPRPGSVDHGQVIDKEYEEPQSVESELKIRLKWTRKLLGLVTFLLIMESCFIFNTFIIQSRVCY